LTDETEQFHLGKMVGETMGRLSERIRITKLIENLELTTVNPVTQEVSLVEMDWGTLFDEINNPEES
jgi:hypothetical protein